MTISSVNLPIDVAISQAYGTIQDDSTQDLRNVMEEIDANSQRKQALRDMSTQLALVKAAVEAGDGNKAKNELNTLMNLMKAAGYHDRAGFGKVAATTPDEISNPHQDLDVGSVNLGSEEATKSVQGYLDSVETALKGEMDRYSDISSKLQVEMNTKSSILRRAEKAVSDNESAFQKNNDGILRNMKG